MRAKFTAGAAAVALLIGAGALAQTQDKPESLLPPGFGDPTPPAAPSPPSVDDAGPAPARPPLMVQPLPEAADGAAPPAAEDKLEEPEPVDPETLAYYEMPTFARRSLDRVGVGGSAAGGVRPDAFGSADGRYIETLMRRLSAPLPSRWLSITLRRALMSEVDTPANVHGADFAAERAWLLLRMGEADGARAIVQAVDNANYTPKLAQVAMQAALANADPALLCPLSDLPAAQRAGDRAWVLSRAICTGITGDARAARAQIATARRQRVASGIDLQLAQKVLGAGAESRQAVTIEWDSVVDLTAWRFGLATATGVTIPDALYQTVGAHVAGWRALAAAIPAALRVAPAEAAAAWGVLSSAALVDLYGALDGAEDTPSSVTATATDLREAYVGGDAATRLSAMTQLWDAPETPALRYARLVLTARAAARVRPTGDHPEADRLVASMLSAGLDRTAGRWRGVVPEGSDAWAMLALSDPDADRVGYSALSGYAGKGDAARKQRMLFAGLAALGRLSPDDIERGAEALEVRVGAENAWTRALDRAAAGGQQGSVVLLAAIGMQTANWSGISPETLYRIVGALRAVGLDGEARMIAAEAIARL